MLILGNSISSRISILIENVTIRAFEICVNQVLYLSNIWISECIPNWKANKLEIIVIVEAIACIIG